MNRALQLIFLLSLFPLFPSKSFAEEQSLLKVYLDCRKGSCDRDFLKRELNFIEFVRNREDSQVHALITRERNATGRKYTLFLYGGGEFSEEDLELPTSTLNVEMISLLDTQAFPRTLSNLINANFCGSFIK